MSAGQHMDEYQAMIDEQAPISQQPGADGQALLLAAEQGDAATVRALLAAGLDPNAARQPGTRFSALHLAAAGGHVSIIMTLLAFGAVIDDSNTAEAVTPLRLALQGRHISAVQVLLGAGSSGVPEGLQARDGGASLPSTLAGAGFDVSQSALGQAIEAEDFNRVKQLLQLGVPPGDECGRALVTAAAEGWLDDVEALLEAGVPADCAAFCALWDDEGLEGHEDEPRTALLAAAGGGHADIMRCLLAAGADVELRGWIHCGAYNEVIHVTALEVCRTAEAARVLLEAGAAVQDPARGYFPLHTHILVSDYYYYLDDVIPVLLEGGADPNAADLEGYTALHHAVLKDAAAAVASLLAAGADVNITFRRGSPMHVARSSEVVHALLRAGADIHAARACDGRTPLICAAHYHSGEAVEALLAAGASVHDTDKDGNAALHAVSGDAYGSNGGGEIVVELLCAAGADVNAANNSGKDPLAMAVGSLPTWTAVNQGFKAVVGALIAAGATPTTELLAQVLAHRPWRGSWMTVLLPSRRISISIAQLREWAGAAFSGRLDAKQAMFWGVWALRRRLPTELLHLIAALCCMLE